MHILTQIGRDYRIQVPQVGRLILTPKGEHCKPDPLQACFTPGRTH